MGFYQGERSEQASRRAERAAEGERSEPEAASGASPPLPHMFLTVQPVKSHELDGLSLSSSLDLNGNPVSEKMARGPLLITPKVGRSNPGSAVATI